MERRSSLQVPPERRRRFSPAQEARARHVGRCLDGWVQHRGCAVANHLAHCHANTHVYANKYSYRYVHAYCYTTSTADPDADRYSHAHSYATETPELLRLTVDVDPLVVKQGHTLVVQSRCESCHYRKRHLRWAGLVLCSQSRRSLGRGRAWR